MEWIIENKEWLFSGVGIAGITSLLGLLYNKNKQPSQYIESGDNSTNIQGGNNIRVKNGRIDDER